MNDLWQSLGTDGAIEWQTRWVDTKRNAGLSIQHPTSYTNLIRSAPSMAIEVAEAINDRAVAALERCTDSRLLADPKKASRLVFSDLQRSVDNSLKDVAKEHALRIPHSSIRDIAQIEAERVAVRLVTLSSALAARMQQRAIECSRADYRTAGCESGQRDRIKMWVSIGGLVATTIGGVLWAIFVDFAHGMYAIFISLIAGASALSHSRHSPLQ